VVSREFDTPDATWCSVPCTVVAAAAGSTWEIAESIPAAPNA
jgi:hypothetical protein